MDKILSDAQNLINQMDEKQIVACYDLLKFRTYSLGATKKRMVSVNSTVVWNGRAGHSEQQLLK